MKYALLLQNDAADVARWKQLGEDEAREARAAEIPKWVALMERMEARGQRLSGLELDEPETAKVVRVVNGETVVTDGPYAETKEQLGGILILEATDLNHAIQLMSKHPGVKMGPFEIRPAADLSGMIEESEKRRTVAK